MERLSKLRFGTPLAKNDIEPSRVRITVEQLVLY